MEVNQKNFMIQLEPKLWITSRIITGFTIIATLQHILLKLVIVCKDCNAFSIIYE